MTKLQFQVFYYLTFYDGSFPFEQVYDFCEFDRDGTLNYAEFEYCFCYTNDAEIEQYFLDQESQGQAGSDDSTGNNEGSTDDGTDQNLHDSQPVDGEDEMLEPQECEDVADIIFSNYNVEGQDLSLEEFALFLSEYFETDEDATPFFNECDLDQNYYLSYDEFVSCQCFGDDAEEQAYLECLAMAEEDFRELDSPKDDNIFLTKDEFDQFWSNQSCNSTPLETIFTDFDFNDDHQLDVDEFS